MKPNTEGQKLNIWLTKVKSYIKKRWLWEIESIKVKAVNSDVDEVLTRFIECPVEFSKGQNLEVLIFDFGL